MLFKIKGKRFKLETVDAGIKCIKLQNVPCSCSVKHGLIASTESIRATFGKENICIVVSLDLSKVFDCADHRMLLAKLSHYGIEHPWFESCLSGRRQYVRGCNDVKCNVLYDN